ncbi:heterokaryon incompatibility protein-domain-containing protein [Nemania sp. FL0916]|nr:heterokaryon incompatibility protein-domain-containing protein [Nemania sp. FL0916]
MRLLHSKFMILREFTGKNVPPYAILSHTWGEGEISFEDMERGRGLELKDHKIIKCCEQAQRDYLEYVWIDTCCIDKRSSAELSEAINSMYRWYSRAQVCYAYLEDVAWPAGSMLDHTAVDHGLRPSFKSSRWFSRGWTLQELIAPPAVVFYSTEWSKLGSRESLKDSLAELTGIAPHALDGNFHGFSVAQKMSWASCRETTRVEDEAYCLLGLFDVSMPLIYGEGRMAFRRLQEEIIKRSDDETIFAWGDKGPPGTFDMLLASSPANFKLSRHLQRSDPWLDLSRRHFRDKKPWNPPPFSVTHKGVQISLQVIENIAPNPLGGLHGTNEIRHNEGCTFAVLGCHNKEYSGEYVAIAIDQENGTINTYTRRGRGLYALHSELIGRKAKMKEIFLSIDHKPANGDVYPRMMVRRLIIIEPFPETIAPVKLVMVIPTERNNAENGFFPFGDPSFHSSGATLIMCPFNFFLFRDASIYRRNPLALIFKTIHDATVVLSIAPTDEKTLMATISSTNDVELHRSFDIARRDIIAEKIERRRVTAAMPASGSDTTFLNVSAHVEDGDHAWIVRCRVDESP